VSSTDQCNTACSLSAGVSKPKVFRGRWLSRRAIAVRCAWEMRAKLVPLGKYWRTKPLLLVPVALEMVTWFGPVHLKSKRTRYSRKDAA